MQKLKHYIELLIEDQYQLDFSKKRINTSIANDGELLASYMTVLLFHHLIDCQVVLLVDHKLLSGAFHNINPAK